MELEEELAKPLISLLLDLSINNKNHTLTQPNSLENYQPHKYTGKEGEKKVKIPPNQNPLFFP